MKPNLSLYNKQWGEQWPVRRQLRHALTSQTPAGPASEPIRTETNDWVFAPEPPWLHLPQFTSLISSSKLEFFFSFSFFFGGFCFVFVFFNNRSQLQTLARFPPRGGYLKRNDLVGNLVESDANVFKYKHTKRERRQERVPGRRRAPAGRSRRTYSYWAQNKVMDPYRLIITYTNIASVCGYAEWDYTTCRRRADVFTQSGQHIETQWTLICMYLPLNSKNTSLKYALMAITGE